MKYIEFIIDFKICNKFLFTSLNISHVVQKPMFKFIEYDLHTIN